MGSSQQLEDPQVTIAGREGRPVPVKRSIAELYIRVFSHMPIDEVIERKSSKAAENAYFKAQVHAAEVSWAKRDQRTALDTVGLMGGGDNVSVGYGSVVKVKRKVAILNKADFKYFHGGNEPLQRVVRHHPSMSIPVRGGVAGETEKVWLFENFPGARRTMSFCTFHRVTAGSTPVRPDDVFYDGQVVDFYQKGLSTQKSEFDADLVAKDLPCINATRGKFNLVPLKLHEAGEAADEVPQGAAPGSPSAAAAGSAVGEDEADADGAASGLGDATLSGVIQLPSAFGRSRSDVGMPPTKRSRRGKKSPAADLDASPFAADDDIGLDDSASQVAASTMVGAASGIGGTVDSKQGPYKHIKNLDCEMEMVKGNLGNALHHANKWVREHGSELKWSQGAADLKAHIKKFEMAHIVSVAHQDTYQDDEVAKAVLFLVQTDGALPDAVNLKLCMRESRRKMKQISDGDAFVAFFASTLPCNPSHTDSFISSSPTLSALKLEPEIKIGTFLGCFINDWLCPCIEAGKSAQDLLTTAVDIIGNKVSEIVASSDMPEEYLGFFCSLSEITLALSTLLHGLDAATLDDFASRVKHHVTILSDAKAKDPMAQRIARSILATPIYVDLLADLRKTSQGLTTMNQEVEHANVVLTTKMPDICGESEEWRLTCHTGAVLAKNLLGLLDVLGRTYGGELKESALDRARVIVMGMRERAAKGLVSLTGSKSFAEMISYQRIAWHSEAFLVEAESDAADMLVKITADGEVANFKVELTKAANAEILSQDILESVKSIFEKVRGTNVNDDHVNSELMKVVRRCIQIALDTNSDCQELKSASLNALAGALELLPPCTYHRGVLGALRQRHELVALETAFRKKHCTEGGVNLDASHTDDTLVTMKGSTKVLFEKVSFMNFPDDEETAHIKKIATDCGNGVQELIHQVASHGLEVKLLAYQDKTLKGLRSEQGGLKNGANWIDGLPNGMDEKWDKTRAVGKATLLADGIAVGLRKKVDAALQEEAAIRKWAKTFELPIDENIFQCGSGAMGRCIKAWGASLMIKAIADGVDKVSLRKAAMAVQTELGKRQLTLESLQPSSLAKKAVDAMHFK
ncbi:unnamed protein product [Prorocentrum cordatum]|uniref:Uncharacterized protein n=1 Tax=Prorocentrum cordatum TaxID=2364126 RepID=A0ABN9SBD7_9DINO|nr:unnamed protein product [Polarella glacialis]